jgi:hypothetical protein
MTQVFGKHVGWILICRYPEEFHFAFLYALSNVVIPNINMFGASFLNWVRGNKN